MPGLRPGEVLEYDMVTVIHTPLAAGQFWADYDFDKISIMLDETVDVDVPADRAVKLKSKPGMDPTVTRKTAAASITGPVLTWSAKTIQGQRQGQEKEAAPPR